MSENFNLTPNFLEDEIARLKFVIGEIQLKGEKAIPEFDIKRGIDKQKILELLNKQLAYFKEQKLNLKAPVL